MFTWSDILMNGKKIGDLTNIIWSYRLEANIGFALVSVDATAGQSVSVALSTGTKTGKLVDLPFI